MNYEQELLVKLYKYLGSCFGSENFVGKYDPDGKYDCYECGNDMENETVLELRKYVENLNK